MNPSCTGTRATSCTQAQIAERYSRWCSRPSEPKQISLAESDLGRPKHGKTAGSELSIATGISGSVPTVD